jgi:hypothetical protein
VAEKLPLLGKADTVQRRLERWLHNGRLDWQACYQAWARWVLGHYSGRRLVLLVAETKLGERLSVLVVGLAYRGGCIPLAFWCDLPKQWPLGQVELILTLLAWIAPALPTGLIPLVQADRGIGMSPELLRRIQHLGWHFLVRVQKNTRLRREAAPDCPLASLVSQAGQTWRGQGQVFKKAGWLDASVWVDGVWEVGQAEPGCLFSHQPDLPPLLYGLRFHHEWGFRDLKRAGCNWQRSRVWLPSHVERLLLVLALARLWTLAHGTKVRHLYPLCRRQQRLSIFRLGLDYLYEYFHAQQHKGVDL